LVLSFDSATARAQLVTDCIEEGGKTVCAPHYPTPWGYGLCDNTAGYVYRYVAWCGATNGTWVGLYNGGCVNGTPTDEGNITDQAVGFNNRVYSDTCWVDSDTGWGATVNAYWCFAGSPTYSESYLVHDFRVITVKCSKGGGEAIFARKDRSLECPTGYADKYTPRGWLCAAPTDVSETCSNGDDGDNYDDVGVGNPIAPASGLKLLNETDYAATGGLAFTRQYHSQRGYEPYSATNGTHTENRLGDVWRSNFDKRVIPIASSSYASAAVTAPSGQVQYYGPSGNSILNYRGGKTAMVKTANGYYLNGPDGTEFFGLDGRLKKIARRTGEVLSLAYSDGTTGAGGGYVVDATGAATTIPLAANMLTQVTDAYGNVLGLQYDGSGRVIVLTEPGGAKTIYGYDAKQNLTSVKHADNTLRTYKYNEAPTSTNWPAARHALTSIVDELGVVFATYTYASTGKAIKTAHAGDVGIAQLAYAAGSTSVTDALGTTRTLTFQNVDGIPRFKSTSVVGGKGYGTGVKDRTFDSNGNVTSETHFDGRKTCFAYDVTRNLETVRVDGVDAGTACAGLLTAAATLPAGAVKYETEWHPRWDLHTRTSGPGRIKTYRYNGDASGAVSCAPASAVIDDGSQNGQPIGVLCDVSTQATVDRIDGKDGLAATADSAPARTTQYTYSATGQLLTEDGPRTDVSDVTTYMYFANDDADPTKRGRVATVTNGLGQVTQYTAYTPSGQPLTSIDANGVTTTMEYDSRRQLVARTVDGAKTSYAYDAAGQLTRITAPDGSTTDYAYDPAHRLTEVAQADGGRFVRTYDKLDNVLSEAFFDAQAQKVGYSSRVFNDLGQLVKEKDSAGVDLLTYAYDAAGNRISATDGTGRVTTYAYDALQRLKEVQIASSVERTLEYDGENHVTTYTDALGHVTSTAFDGLGQRLSNTSPETGMSAFTYDGAGNILTRVDALNNTTTFQYDALNRLTKIVAQDGSTSELTYDQGTYGNGRLTTVKDASGTRTFTYDAMGRRIRDERALTLPNATVNLAVEYGYDGADRVSSMKYPSGAVVTYTRDALGRITEVSASSSNGPTVLATQITHAPLGPMTSGLGVGGTPLVATLDADRRTASYAVGGETRSIVYDGAGLVTQVNGAAGATFTYAYDERERVTSGSGPKGTFAFTYDAAGNLTKRDIGGSVTDFTVSSTSNRLEGASGASTITYTYDAAGNLKSDGMRELSYDALGRLVDVKVGAAQVHYVIDTLGQRVGRVEK
jgi:YD repeat-containing protein